MNNQSVVVINQDTARGGCCAIGCGLGCAGFSLLMALSILMSLFG